jgi:RNA polymerase sigma factor (TIGR02999 family)
VTELLVDLQDGDDTVVDALFDEAYPELRRRAQGQRKRWRGDRSLRTTALAHEVYLKLLNQDEQSWESRSHFFAVAARAMRHILVDRARNKQAQKRGGDVEIRSLEALREAFEREQATAEERSERIVVLDAALGEKDAAYARSRRSRRGDTTTSSGSATSTRKFWGPSARPPVTKPSSRPLSVDPPEIRPPRISACALRCDHRAPHREEGVSWYRDEIRDFGTLRSPNRKRKAGPPAKEMRF